MPARRRRSRRSLKRPWVGASIVVGLLAVALSVVVLLVVQRWQADAGAGAAGDEGAGGTNTGSPLAATLYFVTEDGRALTRHEADLPFGADLLARARAVIEQQLAPPPPPLLSPFPEDTSLLALYLASDGNVFVDLSEEVTTGHSGGSLDELFTVYALVNALTISVPEITAVQIMVEGREVDTLAGHVDLRQPLEPSLAWVVDPDAPDNPTETDAEEFAETAAADETAGEEVSDDAQPETDERT